MRFVEVLRVDYVGGLYNFGEAVLTSTMGVVGLQKVGESVLTSAKRVGRAPNEKIEGAPISNLLY